MNFNSDCPTISGLSGFSCNDLVNLNGNCGPARLTVDQDSNSAYAGVIADGIDHPGGSVLKVGCGDLTLSGQSTFTGGFTLEEGALLIGSSSLLDCSGFIASGPVGTGTLTLASGTTLGLADNGSYTLHNDIALDCFGTVKIDTGCGDLTLKGYISGNAGLIKKGDGTLTLANDTNDFSGDVTVKHGTLAIKGSSTAEYDDGGMLIHVLNGPVGKGTLKLETGTTLAVADSGSYTLDNYVDLGCFTGTVKIDTGCGDLTLKGYIGGSAGIVKKGEGILTLANGTNDFSGDVTVQHGTLAIGGSSMIDTFGCIISGPVGTGTLKFETNGCTVTLTLANDGTYTLHNNIDLGCFSGAVAIDTGCGDLTLAGAISGSAGITKAGTGALTLTGASTYAGDTTVKSGTLTVNPGSPHLDRQCDRRPRQRRQWHARHFRRRRGFQLQRHHRLGSRQHRHRDGQRRHLFLDQLRQYPGR
ncbi:MAG: autotransporter-associated beta strand repeat-containing protein [Lacunisphaera sp.]